MIHIFKVKGRAINKGFSILFGVLTLIHFGLFLLTRQKDRGVSHTCSVMALIYLGFFLLFLIKWVKWYFVEKKKQKELTEYFEHTEEISEAASDAYSAVFEIPYKELLSEAGKLYHNTMKYTAIISICLGMLLIACIIKNKTYDGISTILVVLGVIAYMPLMAYLIQTPKYKQYQKTIPHRIIFQISFLTINQKQYYARGISEIILSPKQVMNTNAAKIYRSITVCCGNKKDIYNIDYRSQAKESLRYADYDKLLEYCKKWCRENGVKLTVNYLEK